MLNKNRSKIVIYSLIGLATVALATVGFSGWIIDGSVKDANENVSVTVSEIADRTTVIEVLGSECDKVVCFDYDKNSQNKNPNIVFDDDTSKTPGEDLIFSIKFTIKSNSALNLENKHTIRFTFDETTKTKFQEINANDKNFIDYSCIQDFSFNLPTDNNSSVTSLKNITNSVTYSNEYKTATIVSTFTFDWGDYFNGKNPCEYGTEEGEEDYKEKILEFDRVLKDRTVPITLNISVTYNN